MPDDPIIALTRVSEKGSVQIPLEIRLKLDLRPGTRMVILAAEDAVVLQKAESLLTREPSRGILRKIWMIFSRLPIMDIEE